jgi:hypothetical protein
MCSSILCDIRTGWLCQDRVQWIPEELGAQFQVAIDLNESINDVDAWNDYCSMFERIGRTSACNFSCNTSPPYDGNTATNGYMTSLYTDEQTKQNVKPYLEEFQNENQTSVVSPLDSLLLIGLLSTEPYFQ